MRSFNQYVLQRESFQGVNSLKIGKREDWVHQEAGKLWDIAYDLYSFAGQYKGRQNSVGYLWRPQLEEAIADMMEKIGHVRGLDSGEGVDMSLMRDLYSSINTVSKEIANLHQKFERSVKDAIATREGHRFLQLLGKLENQLEIVGEKNVIDATPGATKSVPALPAPRTEAPALPAPRTDKRTKLRR